MNNEHPDSSTESHVLDEIPTYLAGGLEAAERERVDTHIAACPECGAAMVDAKSMDDSLHTLFDKISPDHGFEDRLIAQFREKTTRRTLHPMVRRAAIGVAASILLGSVGFYAQRNMGRLEHLRTASNLSQMGLAMRSESDADRNGGTEQDYMAQTSAALPTTQPAVIHTDNGINLNGGILTLNGRSITTKDGRVSAGMMDTITVPQKTGKFFDAEGTKSGTGTLTLQGQNSYTGATTITNGTLTVNGPVSGAGKAQGTVRNNQGQNVFYGDGHTEWASSALNYRLAPAAAKPDQKPSAVSAAPPDIVDLLLRPTADGPAASATPAPVNKESSRDLGTSATLGLPQPAPAPVIVAPAYSAVPSLSEASKKAEVAQALSDSSGAPGKPGDDAKETHESGARSLEPAQDAPAAPAANQIASRKIIREGEMAFEIDSFDSTVMNIGKIVTEEGGFVSTTDSDKLANGKVRGSIVVRIPPEHLDTLVLKLRGIGDLKSQKINAQDITKQYTDLESELRAARAMEDRLLEIIKTGKGAVKDLLEAEKQLGIWREKIEHVEGELRYDNNLISLSTLSITLMERDIKSAAFSSINEQVTMALETEKVEEAYNAAREAIDNAKGRIVQSELKQYDAGQYGGTLRAQLPPDAADAVIGRLRQLDGRLANFQRQRSQSDQGGTAAPLDTSKVKHESVTLSLTIYNLANIAPRRTTTLTLAAGNVEEAYAAILDLASKGGARVVASNLNRSRPEQSSGAITLSAPSDKADALLAGLRGSGGLLSQETNENPDTQNVTTAKRGIIVQVISLASVQARQSESLQLASLDVPGAFGTILDALRVADARIIASQLNQQDPANKSATIVFDISRTARLPIDATIDKVGEIVSRNITRSQDTANTLESKIHCEMTLQSAEVLPARETTTLGMEVPDVQKSVNDVLGAVGELGGREIDKDISQDPNGRSLAHVIVEVPLDKAGALSERIERFGHRRAKQVARNPQAPQGKLARGRLELTLADTSASLGGEETTWDAIRHGLSVSGEGLRWSAQMVVVGICFVTPWLLAIWIAWRLFARRRRGTGVPPV